MERIPLRHVEGLVMLGNPGYGGWLVPEPLIEPGWVCYAVGAGGEVSRIALPLALLEDAK